MIMIRIRIMIIIIDIMIIIIIIIIVLVIITIIELIEKVDTIFWANVSQVNTCKQNVAFRNSSRDSAASGDSGDSPEMVQTGPVQPWVLHAPGAKMTVVCTNSFKSPHIHHRPPSVHLEPC